MSHHKWSNKNSGAARSSRFICCRCLKENYAGAGIQRHTNRQREKYHIKDLTCFSKDCNGIVTKNIEIRYKDSFDEIMEKAKELNELYYTKEGEYNE